MNRQELIEAALAAAEIHAPIARIRPLAGGCIHTVMHVELADGDSVVAKMASRSQAAMLREEQMSLQAISATATVRVPRPLALVSAKSTSVLLTEFLRAGSSTDATWSEFGERLARMHAWNGETRYGFLVDNHIGSMPQPNDWHADWVEFNRACRLGHQLTLAQNSSLLHPAEAKRIENVISRLDQLIPHVPKPSLLHGDLWSGNSLATADEDGRSCIAVIDPACSFGDGWADIAMMQLFGGFPRACFEAYEASVNDHAQRDSRIAVYQLYHVLNHVNIFGRGYVAQAMALASALGA